MAGTDTRNYAQMLGITQGMIVQEIGWDDDASEEVRDSVEEACGDALLDEDTDEVIDIVILWWRDGDGDLIDELVDAISPLSEDGAIWVLTPKTGTPGYVEPSEIAESAPTAGLTQTSTVNLGAWTGARLEQPRAKAGKRQ